MAALFFLRKTCIHAKKVVPLQSIWIETMRKKSTKNILYTIILLVVISVATWVVDRLDASEEQKLTAEVTTAPAEHVCDLANEAVAYELPRIVAERSEQVIQHLGYTVSYNPVWLLPNWVAYELTNAETEGLQERKNHFKPDPLVKGDAVVTGDYANSGYDRGHMAPAADMKWSETAMRESFYMTNICPQVHSLNAGDWKDLEELARDWANLYGNIYIACGPIVEKEYTTIGKNHRIAVPASFYKVFLRWTKKGWTSIGFVMPNKAGNKPLMTYMHSVDEIEQLTGIDFFYNLPDSVENRIESDYTIADWTSQKR